LIPDASAPSALHPAFGLLPAGAYRARRTEPLRGSDKKGRAASRPFGPKRRPPPERTDDAMEYFAVGRGIQPTGRQVPARAENGRSRAHFTRPTANYSSVSGPKCRSAHGS